jgi:protein gp37
VTRIPWADETWNPMTGCTPVSEACQNCYAERMARRIYRMAGIGQHPEMAEEAARCDLAGKAAVAPAKFPCPSGFYPTFYPHRLDEPLHWRKPRRIFVCSMSDLFHEAFSDSDIAAVFSIMDHCPQHTFMVLTKRPERMKRWFDSMAEHSTLGFCYGAATRYTSELYGRDNHAETWPLPNLWLGVTVENQQRADERIPVLLDTPAAVRFVSVEPMLGAVNLNPWLSGLEANCGRTDDGSLGPCVLKAGHFGPCYGPGDVASDWTPAHEVPSLDWVILGGETGPGARPMQPEWALDVYRQCKAAGVPFFFKKWGSNREVKPFLSLYGPDILDMTSTREFPEATHD